MSSVEYFCSYVVKTRQYFSISHPILTYIILLVMPNKSYSVAFKKKAVERSRQIGIRPAAREFHVDERRIREWKSKTAQFHGISNSQSSNRLRLSGGGRKPLLPEVEQNLSSWIISERENYRRVTRKAIASKATELANNNPDFKASRGWVDKFLHRNDFSIRVRTTSGQRLPEQLASKVSSFVEFCMKMRIRHNFDLSNIGNMDETAVWADMPGNRTVDSKGVRTVPVLTTGHEKQRVTVCLAAMANGRKLQPMILFKGKFISLQLNIGLLYDNISSYNYFQLKINLPL